MLITSLTCPKMYYVVRLRWCGRLQKWPQIPHTPVGKQLCNVTLLPSGEKVWSVSSLPETQLGCVTRFGQWDVSKPDPGEAPIHCSLGLVVLLPLGRLWLSPWEWALLDSGTTSDVGPSLPITPADTKPMARHEWICPAQLSLQWSSEISWPGPD